MNLPALSIRRHVLAYMLSGVLVLFGVVSFERIGVDRYPAIDFPIISVTTALPGASPEVIDSSLTSVLETAINGVPGIEHVLSTSAAGVSVVAVQFVLEKDADVAFNEVQAKVNQVLPQLPAEAEPPVVAKLEFGAMPVLWLALTGDRTLQQLNQHARNVIKKRLETVDGVAEVRLGGKRERTIRVDLAPGRLAQFGITVGDVVRAFGAEHVQPLVIMVAQPLAIIGGVGALWLTRHSLNIYSMIGLVLLVGLVAKNSILLVDLANQLRAAGSGIGEALEEACPVRMRPVLMTSLTIILALLPAALGYGAGSDTNGPLAVAVLGGMVSSTLLTLVVVPAVYSLVEGGIERLGRRVNHAPHVADGRLPPAGAPGPRGGAPV